MPGFGSVIQNVTFRKSMWRVWADNRSKISQSVKKMSELLNFFTHFGITMEMHIKISANMPDVGFVIQNVTF